MGFLLVGAHAPIRYTAGRLYLSERDKAGTGFVEKANHVGTAQNGAPIKPAKYGESQYRKKGERQRCEETERRKDKRAVNGQTPQNGRAERQGSHRLFP
jgi:hypothetical protein